MNEKLYNIFNKKLQSIKESNNKNLRKSWKEYLSGIEGIDRMGRLMSMVVDCPSDKVQITDPFGEDAVLRVDINLAIKIITLGYIP